MVKHPNYVQPANLWMLVLAKNDGKNLLPQFVASLPFSAM
jgi:hypothetical protein